MPHDALHQSTHASGGADAIDQSGLTGNLAVKSAAGSTVVTPPAGVEYVFLDSENLDNQGIGLLSSKNSAGNVRVRDDLEQVAGVLRPKSGQNLETGTALTTYSALIEGDFTNVGSNVTYSIDHYQLIAPSPATIFDGNDDFDTSNAAMRDGGDQTFITEFRLNAIPGVLVSLFGNTATNTNGIALFINTSGQMFTFIESAGTGTNGPVTAALSIDTDYRVYVSYDNVNSKIYTRVELKDGTNVSDVTHSVTADWNTGTQSDGSFSLGGRGGVGPDVKVLNFEMYKNNVGSHAGFNGYVFNDATSLSFIEGDMRERADDADLPNGEGSYSYITTGNPQVVAVTDGNSAVDTTVLNAAATNYAPGTFEALDENDNPITDGNITLDYNINGAGFTGSLISLNAFKAIPASTFAAATNLAIRTRLILAQTLKSVSIQTTNSKSVLDSTGDLYTEVDGVEAHRLSLKENMIPFYNDTGLEIARGKLIDVSGVDAATRILKGTLADSTSPATSSAVIGAALTAVANGTFGYATKMSRLENLDTSGLSLGGVAYLGTAGDLTSTRPVYPATILIAGSVTKVDASSGVVQFDLARFTRTSASKSYTFPSQGVGAGTYYRGGFYDFPTTAANLSQASLTVTHGSANVVYAAHAGIVPSGPGTVDTGTVGLKVTGTLDSETGVQTAAQEGIITTDITTLTADVYAETAEKFSGTVTFELYVTSGSPTTYSLDFNYGYSKYEDVGNIDFTITTFEAVWYGGANDTTADIELLHHKTTGWTYAATGFVPGDGAICQKSTDQQISGDISNGEEGAYKRSGLSQFIDGNGSEGSLVRVTTGAANTFQSLDLHIFGVSEELA